MNQTNTFGTRRRRLRLAAIVLSLLVGLGVLYVLNPTEYTFMPQCPFRLLTGLSCPGCGIQRAVHALLHGRVAEAWSYNPFMVYSVPYALAVALTEWVWRGGRQARWRRVFEGRVAVWLYLASFCVWGVVRNVLGR